MRSYLDPDKFFSKMKKKPAVQAILDSIENYTDEDIDSLSGPHFPLWIKDQLKKRKTRNGKTADEIAQEIAEKMIEESQRNK